MKAEPSAADRLLQTHDRWLRAAWPLAVAAAGLAATLAAGWRQHPSAGRVEHWGSLPAWWLGGCALTAVAAGIAWAFQRRNLLRSARKLDDRLAAKSRLETATALRDDPGALARAQREETAGFLRAAAGRRRGTSLLALVGLVGALVLSHLVTLVTWTRPWVRPTPAVAGPKPAPPPAELPKATIKWKSPGVETKAAPIEELPLEATAESTTGLRDLVLEMEVNGEPRLKAPVAVDELKAKGRHGIQTSIYLDQLEVQPYDIVSYHLRAQRIDPRPLPETDSPVQFVQVKPFRDDVREVPGGEGNEAFALITALKAAQLRLIKENFLLGHTDLAHGDADWIKENARVGREQGVLAEKTGEVVQKLIDLGAAAEIVDLITQSRPCMDDAAKQIVAAANQPALAPQGKALGLITEVEKFMIKMAPHGGTVHKTVANVQDPFHDKKLYEMKQRFATHAGELELLAREQARLADDLAKGDAPPPPAADAAPDPNKIEGTASERQTQISQRLGALLNGKVFEAEVTHHLESGRELARAALQQLDAADVPAAREPAAAAARELDLAAAAMNKDGDEQTKDQLAQALRRLNQAAEEARTAPRQASDADAQHAAEQARQGAQDTARQLAEAARQQQESGSAKAATRLNELARGLDADEVRKALDRLRAQPRDEAAARNAAERLQAMADRAALPTDAPGLSPDEIAQLINRLERARANLERLALNEHPGASDAQKGADPSNGHPGQEPSDQKGAGSGSKPGSQPDAKAPGDQPGAGTQGKAGQGQKGQGQPPPGQPGQGQPGQSGKPGAGAQPGQGREGSGEQPGNGSGEGTRGLAGGHDAPPHPGGNDPASPAHAGGPPVAPARDTEGGPATGLHDGSVPTGGKEAGAIAYRAHPVVPYVPNAGEAREKFAAELVEDLREAAQAAAPALPASTELTQVKEGLNGLARADLRDVAPLVARIDPPLEGLIRLLRAQAQELHRKYQLADQHLDLAPPAYRAAVAAYFEALSRGDEAAAPAPAPDQP